MGPEKKKGEDNGLGHEVRVPQEERKRGVGEASTAGGN